MGIGDSPAAPPQDLEAEMAVLGALLLQGAVIGRVLETGLLPADFYRGAHAHIFEAAMTLHGRGAGIDGVTLTDELRRTNFLDAAGGVAQLELLSAAVPNVGNVLDYAHVIRRCAHQRQRREAALAVYEDPSAEDAWGYLLRAADTPLDAPHAHRRMELAKVIALADSEPPWRCGQLAADGHVTTLVGRGGEGKSLLTLALAGAVQLGSTLAGIPCKTGRVVIFDAENGPWIMGSRLAKASTPLSALEIYDAEGLDLARHRSWITARAEGANLVIFDSIRTLAPGAKENDSDDMAPVMGSIRHIARSTGAAVIAIHHRGKGDGDFRGSSAVRDQTDMMFVLERADGDPDARHRRALRCVKCRIAEEPPTRWLTIKHAKGELCLYEAAPFEAEAYARPVREELEQAIAQIIADQGPLGRSAIARELDRDPKDQSLRRATNDMLEAGTLVKVNGGKFATPGGGVNAPLTPVDTSDTQESLLGPEGGCQPLKGNDTLTPPSEIEA